MSTSGVFHKPPPTVLDRLAEINWLLLAVLCLLAGVGLTALYSVAGGAWTPWADRHALRFLIGLAMIVVIAVVPIGFWLRLAYPIYAIALALLVLVPLVGTDALGARRWLSLAGMSFQPSELMKVALIAALACYYQRLPATRLSHPVWVLVPVLLILAPMVLIVRQPDLGTALLLGMVGSGLMLLAGVSLWYFIAGTSGMLAAIPLILPHLHDYQRRRIEIFLDPSSDPLGAGYHVTQSKIAMGSGGLNGRGFLAGSQSQLDFLPEKHTDFVFTSIAEEWGFSGGIIVLGLFALLIVILMGMALSTASRAGRMLIAGAMLMIFIQAVVNIAMVSGAVPVVGVPLPFISYGGTSMMTLMFSLGLAMCAWVHRHERHWQTD